MPAQEWWLDLSHVLGLSCIFHPLHTVETDVEAEKNALKLPHSPGGS